MSHDVVADRFAAAGLDTDRFVSVADGEKKCLDHDTRWSDPGEVSGQNYGIYAGEDDQAVVLDVDYHREGSEDVSAVALAALSGLPHALKARSPHVPDDADGRGGHHFFKLTGDETPAELFKRVFGAKNPVASWGEVIAANKYVVGAGSQLDGCSKEWCADCEDDDGGRYSIKKDRPIAEVDPETLVEALAADPDLTDTRNAGENATLGDVGGGGSGATPGRERDHDDLEREAVEAALSHVDPDCGYNPWRDVGFALQSHFDDAAEAKEVFKSWSRGDYSDGGTPTSWDSEASRLADRIIDDATDPGDGGAGVTFGTVVHLATRDDGAGEWEPPWAGRASSPPPEPPDSDGGGRDGGADDGGSGWPHVRSVYQWAEDENESKGRARLAATQQLETLTDWMYVLESERLWMYDEETGVFDGFGGARAGNVLEAELGQYYDQAEKREIIGRLHDRNQVHRSDLNAANRDDPLVCVGNGVINLATGELLDHSPDYRFIRGLDWDYDPARSNPSRILEFLDDVTEREADRDTLLDHLAHGLMPGHPYRAFVVAYGPGANGKTQVSEVFRGFVGEDNSAAVEIDELTGDDRGASDLPGSFINWGDDMAGDGGGTLTDVSMLKKASGGSVIRANEKYEKTYDFQNEAAMFFSANEPPRIGEAKDSIADRLYPIEMPYQFKGEDEYDPEKPLHKKRVPGIAKKILSDDEAMRGLLTLAVEQAQDLIDRGGRYSQPEGPRERLEKYNARADPLARFTVSAVEPAGQGFRIRKDDAYRVYQSLTDEWNERSAGKRGFKRQFPKTFPEDIEDARSRSLATPDDEYDRVPCWKRLKWSESAATRMPDWMVERYADHFEDDVSADSGVENRPEESAGVSRAAPLAELSKGVGAGFDGVTVLEKFTDPDWAEGKGHLADGEGNIKQYVCKNANPLADVAEGDTVNIRRATVEDRKAGMTVVLTGIATVEKANRPSGQAPIDTATDGGESPETRSSGDTTDDTPDTKETADDDESAVSADADGETVRELSPGEKSIQKAVMDYLADHTEPGDVVTVAEVSAAVDRDPETVRDRLDKFAAMGTKVMESEGGEYERI